MKVRITIERVEEASDAGQELDVRAKRWTRLGSNEKRAARNPGHWTDKGEMAILTTRPMVYELNGGEALNIWAHDPPPPAPVDGGG